MPPFDYNSVKPEDLEMVREPRKSVIKIRHKPSGAVAEDPVVPGSLSPARYRRASNLPKENRVKDMEGYIEGASDDDKSLFPIVVGDSPKNEYLDKLAGDPAALKASFEGTPKEQKAKTTAAEQPATAPPPSATPQQPVAPPAPAAAEAPAPPAPQAAPEPAAPSAPAEPAAASEQGNGSSPPAGGTTAGGEGEGDLADLDSMLAELEQ